MPPVEATPAPNSPPPFNVELKKTKVIWAQPAAAAPLTWTETMMGQTWPCRLNFSADACLDLVKFRTMLDERVAEEPLSEIPTEHISLIAKLVQERYISNLGIYSSLLTIPLDVVTKISRV